MNAEEFIDMGFYFKQSLKLVVFAYEEIKRQKSREPYSRSGIYQDAINVRKKSARFHPKKDTVRKSLEIEDPLKTDMVKNLKEFRHKFNLGEFSIQPGPDETEKNIRTGSVDIRFEMISSCNWDGTYFIYECKRLNKYSSYLEAYIKQGVYRFVSGQYYPETSMNRAGMIAFVEVNLDAKPGGYLAVGQVADLLKQRIIHHQGILRIQRQMSPYKLTDKNYPKISDFKHCYSSKHLCGEDSREVTIFHLLLDYYDLLVP